jgi:undecaprenyl-diphosphatase
MERLEAYDLGMLYWFGSWHQPALDQVMIRLTYLGSWNFLATVMLAGVGVFLLNRRPRLAVVLALSAILGWGLEWGVKLLVQRPRPDVVWRLVDLPNQPSFPSGHALCSMAIYGTLGVLGARLVPSKPLAQLMRWAGIVLAVIIGLTRPYLGVHYPSDVLGGWVAGLICVGLAQALTEPEKKLHPS